MKTWSAFFNLIGTLVNDLWSRLTTVLAPAFTAFQTVVQEAWNGVKNGLDLLIAAIKTGFNDWKMLNQPLVAAIDGIRRGVHRGGNRGFRGSSARSSAGSERFFDAIVRLITSLPGVSVGFEANPSGFGTENFTILRTTA